MIKHIIFWIHFPVMTKIFHFMYENLQIMLTILMRHYYSVKKKLKGKEITVLRCKLKFKSLITWQQKVLNIFNPDKTLYKKFLKYLDYDWTVSIKGFL